MRIGGRLNTTRADADGNWAMALPLVPGWNTVTFAQAADSRVGGAWSESCESNEVAVRRARAGRSGHQRPGRLHASRRPARRARQVFYPDVTAVRADGAPVPVACVPPSGSIFRIGTERRAVHRRPIRRPARSAWASSRSPSSTAAPRSSAARRLARGDRPLGTTLDDYANVTVFDVDGHGPARSSAFRRSPHLFLLDEVMPVVCAVTDTLEPDGERAVHGAACVDTTPPDAVPADRHHGRNQRRARARSSLRHLRQRHRRRAGAASVCDHPSGSFFPFGKTLVTCGAIDRHGNKSAVRVVHRRGRRHDAARAEAAGGSSPAIATSRSGARVNYTVTATDNVDPNPTVKCTPPSGALFPLGTTHRQAARRRTPPATRARERSWSR